MNIRAANKADIPTLVNLVKSLAHYYLEDPNGKLPRWLDDTLTPEAFLARIVDADYLNLVFEEADSVVGYVSVKRSGHLYHLFVAEEFQGKGISRLLWEQVKRQCRCNSFTVRSSIHAIPVYSRFGFTESGPVRTREGVFFQQMECELGAR